MTLTDHRGFVWGFNGDKAIIATRSGGKLTVDKGDLRLGQRIAFIPNFAGNAILEVMDLTEAERAVRCGIDPIFAAASRKPDDMPEDEWAVFMETFGTEDEWDAFMTEHPPIEEEDISDGNEIECGESDVDVWDFGDEE